MRLVKGDRAAREHSPAIHRFRDVGITGHVAETVDRAHDRIDVLERWVRTMRMVLVAQAVAIVYLAALR